MDVKPLDINSLSTEIGRRVIDQPDNPPQGVATDREVYVEVVVGAMQLKRGTVDGFEIFSDEPPRVGGNGKFPSALHYVGAGIGFCLLSQIARYAHMLKVAVTRSSVKVRYRKRLAGSVLKGTVNVQWEGVDTYLSLESDAPPEKIAHLIRTAKMGCSAEALVVQAVPMTSTVEVNGKSFHIDGVTDAQ